VHGHPIVKCRNFFGKLSARLFLKPRGPFAERRDRGGIQRMYFVFAQLTGKPERRKLHPVKDLVRIGIADAAE
jgi:hypothetical protein